MSSVILVSTPEQLAQCHAIRRLVFQNEQGYSFEDEGDEDVARGWTPTLTSAAGTKAQTISSYSTLPDRQSAQSAISRPSASSRVWLCSNLRAGRVGDCNWWRR